MTRKSLTTVAGLLAVALLVAAGCASSKKVEPFPKTVEATVEAKQPEPDRIDSIGANPWALKPGEKADIAVRGTAERLVQVNLTGLDGQAAGKSKVINMAPGGAGAYTGSVIADDAMPTGRYRIEAVLSGGPSGEPVKLVSSRALTVELPPPPPPDFCAVAKPILAEPHIYFDYDKSDIKPEALDWIKEAASKIGQCGDRMIRVTIEGHCDERGTVNYNLALGGRRATAVKDALLQQPGMANAKIETVSKGKEEPVIPHAKTEEEHAKNRRAFFVIEFAPAK